jgi:Type II secretion system (T2SS), protein E, N-terminal domain
MITPSLGKRADNQDSPKNSPPSSLQQGGPASPVDQEKVFQLIDRILPFEACLYYQILPLALNGSRLRLGMVNLSDSVALDYVRRILAYMNCSLALQTLPSELHYATLSAYLNHTGKVQQENHPKALDAPSPPVDASCLSEAAALPPLDEPLGQTDPRPIEATTLPQIEPTLPDVAATLPQIEPQIESHLANAAATLPQAESLEPLESLETPPAEPVTPKVEKPRSILLDSPQNYRATLILDYSDEDSVHPLATLEEQAEMSKGKGDEPLAEAQSEGEEPFPSHLAQLSVEATPTLDSDKVTWVQPPAPDGEVTRADLETPQPEAPFTASELIADSDDSNAASASPAEALTRVDADRLNAAAVPPEEALVNANAEPEQLPLAQDPQTFPPSEMLSPGHALPTLELTIAHRDAPIRTLGTLPPPQLLAELLARVLESGIGRLYFERNAQGGRVLWSKNGILKSVLEDLSAEVLQALLEELKRLLGIETSSTSTVQQVEVERSYQKSRLLLRLRFMSNTHGEEATLQVLRGSALKFYQQQQLLNLSRNALGIAHTLYQKVNELRERTQEPVPSEQMLVVTEIDRLMRKMSDDLTNLQQHAVTEEAPEVRPAESAQQT